MVNRLGGAFEIIGLRAAMLDVRQYIADGKAIERANDSLAANTKKLDSLKLASAANNKALAASQLNTLTAARNLANANATLAASQGRAAQRIPAGQPGAGRFQANPAIAAQAAAQKTFNQAVKETNTLQAQQFRITSQIATENQVIADLGIKQAAAQAERNRLFTGLVATGGAIAITAGVAASIASAAKYQTTLGKIRTLTEATDEDVQSLGKSFLELSKSVPVSPDDLGATAYQVLSSGIKDVGEAIDITTLAAKGQAIGLGQAADVARTITQVINAYGKENITASQAADILGKAAQLGSGDAADFASSLGRVLGIASQAGVKFDALAASVASLTNIGLSAEEAVTAIRGAIQAILNPTNEARAALFSVGLSIDGLRKSIASGDFVGLLQDLITKFHGNLAAIEPIIPNIRALTGVVSAFGVQGKQTANILKEIDQGNGFVNASFEKIKGNVSVQASILKNELNATLIELGTTVLPQVSKGLSDLTKFFEENRKSIVQFGTVGIKLFLGILEDLIKGFVTAAKGVLIFYTAISSIAGASVAAAAGVAAIGTALVWALPGSPYIKGLLAIAAVLGTISSGKGGTKNSLLKTGIVAGTTGLGAALGTASFTPFGTLAGAAGGAAAGGLLVHALGLDKANIDKAKTDDILAKATKAADDAAKKLGIDLPSLNRTLDDSARAVQLDADEIQNLEKQFRSQSEAAAEFKNNFDFKDVLTGEALFAQVPKKLADALNLSDIGAGNVQAVNALKNAEARAKDETYQLNAALGTLALAFQRSAQVANQILLSMASAAQEASQKALSELLGQPSREQANTNVKLSQAQLQQAQFNVQNGQNLQQLQNSLSNIDAQITAAQSATRARQQAEQNAQKAAQQSAQQRQQESDANAKAAADAQQAALDQLELANKLAQAGFNKMEAELQILIDTNNKSLSDLQAAFLQSNEDLQAQINKSIGQGDTAGALALVEKQKKAAQDFQQKQKDLTKSTQDLTYQQTQLKDQEALASALASAQEASLGATQKQTKSIVGSTAAIDASVSSTNDNTDATDSNTTSLEQQRDSIQKNIDAINKQGDSLGNNVKNLQDFSTFLSAQKDVAKALGQAADQTLRSQSAQLAEADKLISQISIESGLVATLNKNLGTDPLASINDANRKFAELTQAIDVATNIDIRQKFIDQGIDPATVELQIFTGTASRLNDKLQAAGNALENYSTKFESTSSKVLNDIAAGASGFKAITNNIGPSKISPLPGTKISPPTLQGAGLKTNAYGGIYDDPTLTWIGEEHKREWVIPSGHPQRAQEILSTIPASLLAPLYARKSGGSIFAPTYNIQGETLETMEAVAHRALSDSFRQARNTSSRSGSLLTSGVG